ncbi:MAG: Asp-tRNA(Asn)/Glu-tRNA(Gln) amidotransferase subunit GatC [Desulfuromonadaceae bacterium]|nr:Asp-tRNA(Asn)/Glu-tRNA(Gln) amidotransferase subunit GatC [Desulfuromonas sp.]MDY0185523.1 Asp-tRNA(Asn)/Glu-tRNA(Gln) amidotransferase subunit GatC [Desulfuromonadaceae bacterium]
MREKITREEVEKVARLARLECSAAEIDLLADQFEAIMARVEQLNELNTDTVEPTSHAVLLENVFRADEVQDSIGVEQALRNAPLQAQDCFAVPKVIE